MIAKFLPSLFIACTLAATLSGMSAHLRAAASAALDRLQERPSRPSQSVKPNRKVPDVQRPPLAPVFGTRPTAAEITRARVFEEPLVPLGETTAREDAALANAIVAYQARRQPENLEPFDRFFGRFATSAWRPSLLVNAGLVYRRTGYFSRALNAFEQVWQATKERQNDAGRAVADRALGELFHMNASVGRFEVLEALFEEIDGRDVRGAATEKISGARQALWIMHNRPEHAFRCGPFALEQILRHTRPGQEIPEKVRSFPSTKTGTSMLQLRGLAADVGLETVVAQRRPGSELIVPSIVHWRLGHFAALVRIEGDKILMRDPTFGDEMWISAAAVDAEASGFFLVNRQVLPRDWARLDDDSAGRIWGRGQVAGNDPNEPPGPPPPPCPPGPGGCPGAPPMAVPFIHPLLVSITLSDTPVGYTPQVGPDVRFRLSYHQRDVHQPQTFWYSNFGRKWTFDWISYLEDDPTLPAAPVKLYHRGGGSETASGYGPCQRL